MVRDGDVAHTAYLTEKERVNRGGEPFLKADVQEYVFVSHVVTFQHLQECQQLGTVGDVDVAGSAVPRVNADQLAVVADVYEAGLLVVGCPFRVERPLQQIV